MQKKNIAFYIICSLFFLTLSCKSNNSTKASDKNNQSTVNQNTIQEEKYPLVLSFYSIGTGVDGNHLRKFSEFLESYQPKLNPIVTPWGREGEVDFCFTLSELSTKQRSQFVKQVREQLKDCKLVHINENAPCVHKRE
jgi:hypothetical protein